jgi:hypothetical protein
MTYQQALERTLSLWADADRTSNEGYELDIPALRNMAESMRDAAVAIANEHELWSAEELPPALLRRAIIKEKRVQGYARSITARMKEAV